MSTKNFLTHTKKYKRILSAVHIVYRLVNSTYNVRELSLRLTRLLCQFIHASSASVYILDPVKKKIVLIANFDSQINTVIEKKKDLAGISQEEKKVAKGMSIFEQRLIGLPLVSDDNIGAIVIRRKRHEKPFNDFDRDMLVVFSEQAVTAIKNLQLYENQQKVILSSLKLIGKMLEKQRRLSPARTDVYFNIVKCLAERLTMGT
ncbi:MAG TPA: GAF domain-containing protein, partial [Candidatus Omnitrophota bacterium]|nr:GAF domain-containing protein [Candidatus Omnitrophota bacterium]